MSKQTKKNLTAARYVTSALVVGGFLVGVVGLSVFQVGQEQQYQSDALVLRTCVGSPTARASAFRAMISPEPVFLDATSERVFVHLSDQSGSCASPVLVYAQSCDAAGTCGSWEQLSATPVPPDANGVLELLLQPERPAIMRFQLQTAENGLSEWSNEIAVQFTSE